MKINFILVLFMQIGMCTLTMAMEDINNNNNLPTHVERPKNPTRVHRSSTKEVKERDTLEASILTADQILKTMIDATREHCELSETAKECWNVVREHMQDQNAAEIMNILIQNLDQGTQELSEDVKGAILNLNEIILNLAQDNVEFREKLLALEAANQDLIKLQNQHVASQKQKLKELNRRRQERLNRVLEQDKPQSWPKYFDGCLSNAWAPCASFIGFNLALSKTAYGRAIHKSLDKNLGGSGSTVVILFTSLLAVQITRDSISYIKEKSK